MFFFAVILTVAVASGLYFTIMAVQTSHPAPVPRLRDAEELHRDFLMTGRD